MRARELSFKGEGGLTIHYRVWEPEAGPPQALILLVHGYAEHAGRYVPLAEYLTGRHYIVYAPDHRGHGRSEGRKGLIASVDPIVRDLKTMLDIARQEYPQRKVFILGHSMGGLMAACFAIRYGPELAGAVLSGAAIEAGAGVSPIVKWISRLLARVAPTAGVQELKSEWLSHDPAMCRNYDEDPLNYRGKVMAQTAQALLAAADWTMEHIAELHIPLLLLHGGDDKIVAPSGSRLIYERASSQDKTLHIFDGLYHEIFNEPDRPAIFRIVADWLDAHCDTHV